LEAFITINNTVPQKYLRAAGWVWLMSGIIYLLGEAIAAAAFEPTYSYARNYISDLGVSECGVISEGRAICSPLHNLMNLNFVLHGLLFFTASTLIIKALKSLMVKYLFLALAGIHLAGNILIAVFQGAAEEGSVTAQYHLIGAVLAIIGGNLAILISSLAKELDAPVVVRTLSRILPVLGFCGFVCLAVAQVYHTSIFFPNGVLERISVDTIMLWEITIGLWLIRTRSAA
jgi:hypothetical membrane protein